MPEEPRQPRAPHNLQVSPRLYFVKYNIKYNILFWQGLLRFAVEATRSEDAPAQAADAVPSAVMDPERRRFLEEALASMTVNVVHQLEAAAAVLTAATSSESDQLSALDCLIDYTDNIDTANDFCKIGGLDILLPLLHIGTVHTVRSAPVRRQCAALIAELAQNNPFCQQQLLDRDALRTLLPLLVEAPNAVATMRAISACVRAYEPAAAAFIEMGGLECVLGCLQNEDADDKLVVQSLFLLRSLCGEFEGVKGKRGCKVQSRITPLLILQKSTDELIKLNAIETIGARLQAAAEYNAALEAALSTLTMLTEPSTTPAGSGDSRAVAAHALAQCHRPALGLRTKLSEIVRICGGHDECLEAVDFARALQRRLFDDGSTTADQVDLVDR